MKMKRTNRNGSDVSKRSISQDTLIQLYLKKSVKELYETIAYHYTPQTKFEGSISLRKRGEMIFEDAEAELFNNICIKWDFCKKHRTMDIDEHDLVSMIIPIVATATNNNYRLFTIPLSCLLVKTGLFKFCKCSET